MEKEKSSLFSRLIQTGRKSMLLEGKTKRESMKKQSYFSHFIWILDHGCSNKH